MTWVAVTDEGDLVKLAQSLNNVTAQLSKEIGIVLWETGKATKKQMQRAIQEEIPITQKYLNKGVLWVKRTRGDLTARGTKTDVEVYLDKDKRLPLKAFKPRESKRMGGVTYKISKKNKDKGHIPNAFLVKAWDNKPMVRKVRGPGSGRGPIRTLYGPSAWGAFVKNGNVTKTLDFITARLPKEYADRIRYNNLKRQGRLRGRQPT